MDTISFADIRSQDTYSAQINFLRICTTNNDPKVIGRFEGTNKDKEALDLVEEKRSSVWVTVIPL